MFRVYATDDKGKGYTTVIYEGDIEDFILRVSLFSKDVVINFERVQTNERHS